MTDGKDFKRLVRQRMAKTGESYTTARAHMRPQAAQSSDATGLGALHERVGVDRLGAHLERRYGIQVSRLTHLDLGVVRVDRQGAPSWVARVFPAARAVEGARRDAAVLRFLADHDVPAERCAADEPVSVHEGQPVLVTEHIAGVNARADMSGETLLALGELAGRVHALAADDVAAHEAGSWHHISPNGGGLRSDVEALLPLVAALERQASGDDRQSLGLVFGLLDGVDGCADLPNALIHPDPSGANAVITARGTPALVDWTGAGRGPRVLSLGALLSGVLQPAPGTPPSRDLRRVDAVVAGYRRHVRLTPPELTRLAAAIAGSAIVLDCWSLLFQDVPPQRTARELAARLDAAERAASRAAAAFDLDEEALTGWFAPPTPAVDPSQGVLF